MTPDKDIQRFLQVGHAEGISYLVLLGIAMPLKYFFDFPQAVRIVGSLHGILFVAFIFMIAWLVVQKKMSILSAVKAFVLSLVPFGTFYLNKLNFNTTSIQNTTKEQTLYKKTIKIEVEEAIVISEKK